MPVAADKRSKGKVPLGGVIRCRVRNYSEWSQNYVQVDSFFYLFDLLA